MPKGLLGSILQRLVNSPPRPDRRPRWGRRRHGIAGDGAIRL